MAARQYPGGPALRLRHGLACNIFGLLKRPPTSPHWPDHERQRTWQAVCTNTRPAQKKVPLWHHGAKLPRLHAVACARRGGKYVPSDERIVNPSRKMGDSRIALKEEHMAKPARTDDASGRGRITARLSAEKQEILRLAADLSDSTLNQFVVQSALSAAQQVIEKAEFIHAIKLSIDESKKLFALLGEPATPSESQKPTIKRVRTSEN